MKDLKTKKTTTDEEGYQNKLSEFRAQIDIADQNLLDTLGKRMKISDKIGQVKKSHNVAVLQNKRWNEILGQMILDGDKLGLSEEFVLKLFKAIHQESINRQENVINK